ncbi:DMT family transporter [Pelagibaculum spongiae]|uniref:EamA/RhaT family transporter n=1 Tax=Pelagibaculum spongiae TaxID=2080658 RepID=A0A2V1H0S2_9GAMM|nr:DMT family transporter [Pelagibaculum spongiae]PVZ72249.1 EamA/RhaT family transporter [Pelagibaculum spongiae]
MDTTKPPQDQRTTDQLYKQGIILGLLGTLFFSFKPIIIKLSYLENADIYTPETILFLRMIFALPIFLLIARKNFKTSSQLLTPKILALGLLIGLPGYWLASWLDFKGLELISAQLERLILFSYPLMVALLAKIIWRQKLDKYFWIALIICYSGIAILFSQELHSIGAQAITGGFYIFASAISFSCYLIASKPLITRLGSGLFTSLAMIGSSVAIISHFFLVTPFQKVLEIPINTTSLLIGGGLSIFCTVIPAYLVSRSIELIGPAKLAGINMTGPVITSMLAVFLLNEHFSMYHVIALIMVTYGAFLLSKK